MNKRLTVTAGLRWDPDFAPAALDGGLVFAPGQQSKIYPNAPTGVLYAGDKGADSALRPSGMAYFEPRFSAAFAITPTMVFRAGFGMFQAPMFWAYYNHTTGVAPTDPEYNLSGTASNPISFENPWKSFSASGGKSPFPSPQPFTPDPHLPASEAVFLLPMSVGDAFAPDFRLPMTQTWNAGIEKQLSRTLEVNLTYVGSETYHQETIVDMNPGIFAHGDNRTTYPDFSNIDEVWPEGTANYNAMQIGAVVHNFDNLYVNSHFTWSKAIDLTDSGNTAWHGSLGDPFFDPANKNWNRGIAGTNIPLAWVSSVVYTTPRLSHRTSLVRMVGGSWEVSGIGTLQSGYPFSIGGGNGGDSSGSLQWGDRADLVPGQSINVHQGSKAQWLAHYFNNSAFAPNAPGTFGDSGKNILKGPGMDTWDVALMKNFPFRGRYNLQFRWEMYNAFNHPNFGLPDTTVTDPNFGQITGIGVIPPRVMQGALELSF